SDLAALSSDGTKAVACTFSVPEGARGKSFSVRVGLWIPARIGRPDERLIPDRGRLDRRVTVGVARILPAGEVTIEPAPPES
ncbi:MAG: hypothetical protein HYU66_23435, partial [Armatimonadetes bacterium]|nr:hypothetical protein [Armatimonadota bacterium]